MGISKSLTYYQALITSKVLTGVRMERGGRIADGMMHETEWVLLKMKMFTNNH